MSDGAVTMAPEPYTGEVLFADMTEGQVRLVAGDPPSVNVGPFHVTRVTDYTRGATVGRDNIPIVLYEARVKMIDGVPTKQEKYAVMVPPKKDVGIVCAGCYTQQMTLFNNSRCVSCRTFANHLDTQGENGPRKRLCLNQDPVAKLEAVVDRVKEAGEEVSVVTDLTDLTKVPASDLLQALKDKQELTTEVTDALMANVPTADLLYALKGTHPDGLAGYLNHVEDRDILKYLDNIELSDIIKYIQARDPKLVFDKVVRNGPYLFDSSFEKLEAEMRRRVAGTDTTMKRFYSDNKKRKRQGEPHFTDAPVVTWEYVCDAMFERINGRG